MNIKNIIIFKGKKIIRNNVTYYSNNFATNFSILLCRIDIYRIKFKGKK